MLEEYLGVLSLNRTAWIYFTTLNVHILLLLSWEELTTGDSYR